MLMAHLMARILPGLVLMLTLVMPCLFWGTECEEIKTTRSLALGETKFFDGGKLKKPLAPMFPYGQLHKLKCLSKHFADIFRVHGGVGPAPLKTTLEKYHGLFYRTQLLSSSWLACRPSHCSQTCLCGIGEKYSRNIFKNERFAKYFAK